jgi:3-hydroxyacyl-CoA dehydrogenase
LPFCQYCRSFTFDIVPRELTEAETKKGLTLESKIVRNRLVNEHLNNALKSNPLLFTVKNLLTDHKQTDDMAKIADVDWIIEVVVERLDQKLVLNKLKNTVNQVL